MFWFGKRKNAEKAPKKSKKDKTAKVSTASAAASDYDELTGLLSLSKFYDDAAECIRAYMGARFAFCCTTIGNLVSVNELYGTDAGNAVICEAARLLSNCGTSLIIARERARFFFLTRYNDEQELAKWIESLHQTLSNAGQVIPGQPKVYMQTGIYATEGRLVS